MRQAARGFAAMIRRCLEISVALLLTWLPLLALAPSISATQAAAKPKHPKWESIAPFGAWKNGGFIIYNNEWNTSAAGPQTIWADSFHHWGVTTDQALTTAVKTYPCVQKNYPNIPYSELTYLRSGFTQSMPFAPYLDAEAAYDLWLNNYKIEVMMWVDNHGQTPAGSVIAHVNIYGENFAVYQRGSFMFTFLLTGKQQTTGKAHLLSALRWLVNHHWLRENVRLTQANFGWEVAASDGFADFTVARYWLGTGVKTR
jgi:hypothetical protein